MISDCCPLELGKNRYLFVSRRLCGNLSWQPEKTDARLFKILPWLPIPYQKHSLSGATGPRCFIHSPHTHSLPSLILQRNTTAWCLYRPPLSFPPVSCPGYALCSKSPRYRQRSDGPQTTNGLLRAPRLGRFMTPFTQHRCWLQRPPGLTVLLISA